MSYVSVYGVTDLQGLVAYLNFGKDNKTKYRREHNITRAVESFCTIPINDFVKRGRNLQVGKGYKLAAVSIVQSFSNELDHLDYKNEADLRYINGLGRALAEKEYPGCEFYVVTHVDGKNHNIHNHIVILNEDYQKHHAISTHLLRDIRNTNDELMKEHEMNVIPKPAEQQIIKTFATKKNEKEHGKKWLRKHDFDTVLQQKLNQVLLLKPTSFEELFTLIDKAGVTVKRKMTQGNDGLIAVGIIYRMRLKNDRIRRRKASAIGKKYTYWSLMGATHEAQKEPLTLTFEQKLKYAEKIKDNPFMTLPKFTVKSSNSDDKVAPKQATQPQQVTTPNVTLTADERLQVQKQREFWVKSELAKIKQKLKTKLDQKKSELKRALNKTLEKIEDKKLAKQNNQYSLYTDASISADEYSDYLDKTNNQAGKAKSKAKKKYNNDVKKAQDEFDSELKKSRKELEQQAKKNITKPIPDFDENKRKNYLEKSLSTDNKKKQRSNYKKHRKAKRKQKDLDADGIDDEIEGIRGVTVDGGIIPTDGFDSAELGDTYMNQFTTSFDDVADTSAKVVKQTTTPQNKKQPSFPKPKNQKTQQKASEDYSLRDLEKYWNEADPNNQKTTPNDDLQY